MAQLDNLDPKDPSDEKDYSVNWVRHLVNGEVIVSSEWDVAEGLTHLESEDTFTDTRTFVWVSGGTAGTNYPATNTIVTNNDPPRTLQQTITIRVRER